MLRRNRYHSRLPEDFSGTADIVDMGLPGEVAEVYEFGSFALDPGRRMLLRGTLPIPLAPKVFDTLLYLVQNPDRVLGKDEMMAAIWPGRVLEESNLSQNIFTLRKALESGVAERYIVTSPGRGYRFAAPVRRRIRQSEAVDTGARVADNMVLTGGVPVDSLEPGTKPPKRSVRAAGLITLLSLLVIAGAGLLYEFAHRVTPTATAERSRILLTGIANLTGDPAFSTVPQSVLEVGLSQSPFVSLIPPQQIGKTLQLMEKPANVARSPELLQEICLRNNGKAMLGGSIAAFGNRYVVILEASDCSSGERIVESKAEASGKEDVPRALDGLATLVRTKLGESLASVRQFDVPIEQATTGSFEALRAYSAGEQARQNGDNEAAEPLFRRAIELDPFFALAYAQLAATYVGLREPDPARRNYQRAFELKDRASEKERLWISAEYFKLVGNLGEAIDNYHAMSKLYPLDAGPWESLGDLYTRMARYQDAMVAAQQGLRLNPDDSRAYIILARAYKRANRFVEANATGRQAMARGLDGWAMHCLLYEVAFARGDHATMSEQVAKEAGKSTEAWMVEYQAWAAATAGQLKQARAFFERAISLTKARGEGEVATLSEFYTNYIQALAQFGLYEEARQLVSKVPALETNDDAAYALALIGDFDRATALDRELAQRYPDSTLTNSIIRPINQATIALGQQKPREAIQALEPALSTKLRTFDVPSLLGQANLDLKAPTEALTEFSEIIAHQGVDAISPLYPLAYLGEARARRMQGDLEKSRSAYRQLFSFWKDADADNPLLLDARREYAALSH
jgi:eukaryotic-like serine/threonine-protein kinase